jgi:hypothetical protein
MKTITVKPDEVVEDRAEPERGKAATILLYVHSGDYYDKSVAVHVRITPERAAWILRTLDTLRDVDPNVRALQVYDESATWFESAVGADLEGTETAILLEELTDDPVLLTTEQADALSAAVEDVEIRSEGAVICINPHLAQHKKWDNVWWECREKHCDQDLETSAVSRPTLLQIAGDLYKAT